MNSMTGIGRAQGTVLGTPVRLEIKSVNHRYCDVTFKAPLRYALLETLVQQSIKKRISRGHVDIFLFEEKISQITPAQIQAYQMYYDYLQGIKEALELSDPVTLDHLINGAYNWISAGNDYKALWSGIEPILNKAIEDMRVMRTMEGLHLKEHIKNEIKTLGNIKENIFNLNRTVKNEIERKVKERILERAKEFKELDSQRLHTEVVYYLDKMDISEELIRLDSHLSQALELIEGKEPVGRKLDFLLQEFGREFNTIGSKCLQVQISHLVVEAKTTLEKIREQAMNVE